MKGSITQTNTIMATHKQLMALGIVAGLTGSALIFGSLGVLAAVVHMRATKSDEVTDLTEARAIGQMMWQIGRVRVKGRPLENCAVKESKAVCEFHVNGVRRFLVIEESIVDITKGE